MLLSFAPRRQHTELSAVFQQHKQHCADTLTHCVLQQQWQRILTCSLIPDVLYARIKEVEHHGALAQGIALSQCNSPSWHAVPSQGYKQAKHTTCSVRQQFSAIQRQIALAIHMFASKILPQVTVMHHHQARL